jgi:putative transposase
MNNIRRNHPPAFKAQVVLALLKEEKTVNEICSQFSIHSTQANKWKKRVIENLSHVFDDKMISDQIKEKDHMIDDLFREVGQLKMELDWLKKKMGYPHS